MLRVHNSDLSRSEPFNETEKIIRRTHLAFPRFSQLNSGASVTTRCYLAWRRDAAMYVFKFARCAKMPRAFRASQFTCYSGVYAYITSDYSRVSLRCFNVTPTCHALLSRKRVYICAPNEVVPTRAREKERDWINKERYAWTFIETFH